MRKKFIISIIIVVVLCISGVGIYGYFMLSKINEKELPKSNEELGITPMPSPTPLPAPSEDIAKEKESKKHDIVNIVFFGLDRRAPDDASRSDTIMVVSIDRNNRKVKVSSLMRDMYVPIPGKGNNRINAAYAYGGPALAVKTVNSNFGLDIRNYVTVDFFGLEKLIDKVGGVEINVSDAEAKVLNDYLKELNKLNGNSVQYVKGGQQLLDGRQAVAYSRIRYVGNADYERTERQRRVLNELFKKIKSQGITKLPGTIDTIFPYVETSLSKTEIVWTAMDVINFNTEGIEQFRLPVDGLYSSQSINGMSVLVPDIEENKKKLHEFIYGTN